jgi:flagellar hook-length control protein FliK
VNPPELGPVSVRIDVNGNEASVVFGVHHAETRNALVDALPRLAELLAAGGIVLADAQVGAGLASRRDGATPDGASASRPGVEAGESTAAPRALRGLVDVFA